MNSSHFLITLLTPKTVYTNPLISDGYEIISGYFSLLHFQKLFVWPLNVFVCFGLGMGGHGYGQSESGSGFHSGHFVHMRGLPFRATEGDIAKVRTHTHTHTSVILIISPDRFDRIRHDGIWWKTPLLSQILDGSVAVIWVNISYLKKQYLSSFSSFFLVLLSIEPNEGPHWRGSERQIDWGGWCGIPLPWRRCGSHVQRQEPHAYVLSSSLASLWFSYFSSIVRATC